MGERNLDIEDEFYLKSPEIGVHNKKFQSKYSNDINVSRGFGF
jgi:hypothetical protein